MGGPLQPKMKPPARPVRINVSMFMHRATVLTVLLTCLIISPGCTALKAVPMLNGGEPEFSCPGDFTCPFRLQGHIILVDVRLNGNTKPYTFVLDTAALTVIAPRVAKELHTEEGLYIPGKDSSGKTATIRLVTVAEIRLDKVKVKQCAAAVFDLSSMSNAIDGILGSNFLRHFTIRLDYTARTITFLRHPPPKTMGKGGITVPFKQDMKNGFAPCMQCRINDKWSTAGIIDTGCPDLASLPLSVMRRTDAYKTGRKLTALGSMVQGAFGTAVESCLLRVDSLTTASLKLADFVSTSNHTEAVLFGRAFLVNYVTTLDYPGGRMILQPIAGKPETEPRSFGLTMQKDAGSTRVSGVWPASSAYEQGIRPGDRVLLVNGKEADSMSLLELAALFRDDNTHAITVTMAYTKGNQELTLHKEKLQIPASTSSP